jgi:hypothetical protein
MPALTPFIGCQWVIAGRDTTGCALSDFILEISSLQNLKLDWSLINRYNGRLSLRNLKLADGAHLFNLQGYFPYD